MSIAAVRLTDKICAAAQADPAATITYVIPPEAYSRAEPRGSTSVQVRESHTPGSLIVGTPRNPTRHNRRR